MHDDFAHALAFKLDCHVAIGQNMQLADHRVSPSDLGLNADLLSAPETLAVVRPDGRLTRR